MRVKLLKRKLFQISIFPQNPKPNSNFQIILKFNSPLNDLCYDFVFHFDSDFDFSEFDINKNEREKELYFQG